MERLSVIITAYNNDPLTVAHVMNSMDVSRVPDEIIVINDGGAASLKKKIQRIENKKCRIIYARVKKDIPWNYNGACNLAVWLSSGDYLAFEDNDNFPSRTFYQQALDFFKDNPTIGRCMATKRRVVSTSDLVSKPRSEWDIIGKEGPNMGTAMIQRWMYLEMKGHDERMCGRYGFMYYDWRSRGIKLLTKDKYSGKAGEYFYTKQGQTDLKREMEKQNRFYYIENAHSDEVQHPNGILNFRYEYEIIN